jgi:hypothetical protein
MYLHFCKIFAQGTVIVPFMATRFGRPTFFITVLAQGKMRFCSGRVAGHDSGDQECPQSLHYTFVMTTPAGVLLNIYCHFHHAKYN